METNHGENDQDIRDSAEIGGLISDLSRKDYAARSRAVRHLASLGDEASPALVRALASEDEEVRWQALLALRSIADPATIPALLDALEDYDIGVRWLASDALGAIGVPALAPMLDRLIHRADSVLYREGVTHVLYGLAESSLDPILGPVIRALDQPAAETMAPVAASDALKELKQRNGGAH